MTKEVIKAVIALGILISAVFYPESSEWTIPAVALVVGYYFGRGKETVQAIKK